jgi:TRAP-type C4-dicarboxylate transport system substrate-binding protein
MPSRSRAGRPSRGTAVLLTLLAVAGCSVQTGATSKAGDVTVVTLRMADGFSKLDYVPAVQAFVEGVEQRSDGLLRIDVTHGVGEYRPDFEPSIVRSVAAGTFDLAWSGTRAFELMGVQSFAALTAPMLVDSYPLQNAIVHSELPDRMLAGLSPLHVRGLALLAGGLRKPVGVARPLLRPEDWRGLTFAVFPSDGQAAAVRALGATPSPLFGPALDDALVDGSVDGFEKNLLVYSINSMEGEAPYVTLDVDLWPETAVLIGNPRSLDRLTAEQQRWVQEAATDAADRSADLVDVDQDLLGGLCSVGSHFATSSPDDRAAMAAAVAPVVEDLARDPATRSAIARIRELKAGTPPSDELRVPPGC